MHTGSQAVLPVLSRSKVDLDKRYKCSSGVSSRPAEAESLGTRDSFAPKGMANLTVNFATVADLENPYLTALIIDSV